MQWSLALSVFAGMKPRVSSPAQTRRGGTGLYGQHSRGSRWRLGLKFKGILNQVANWKSPWDKWHCLQTSTPLNTHTHTGRGWGEHLNPASVPRQNKTFSLSLPFSHPPAVPANNSQFIWMASSFKPSPSDVQCHCHKDPRSFPLQFCLPSTHPQPRPGPCVSPPFTNQQLQFYSI